MSSTLARVVIIGLGGIGEKVVRYLSMFLNFLPGDGTRLLLVDGDSFQERDRNRQWFRQLGNKADAMVSELAPVHGRLSYRTVTSFVDENNVSSIIEEQDTVFLCVDNHATRRIVAQHCESLQNVVLISGGNELTDGNVQIHIRRDGKDITHPITKHHPEIARARKGAPSNTAEGCERMVTSEAQLVFTNLTAASAMLNAFYSIISAGYPPFDELYFDVIEVSMAPVRRSHVSAG